MNFSRKILVVFLCVCLFMCATTFMVYAANNPYIITAQNNEEGGQSSEQVTQPPETSSDPVTSAPPPPTPTSSAPPVKKSSNCFLSNLEVVRGVLTPTFNPNITQYNVVITDGEGVPGVKPTLEHPKAKFKKNVPVLPMGGNATATVVVTAEDGTKMTYTLVMTRVPGTSSTESVDLVVTSAYDVSGDYPSENSLDVNALLASSEISSSEIESVSSEDEDKDGGSNWLLYVGLILIAAALCGIIFALYRQFFSRSRDDYGNYGGNYYDDGYGNYGNGYDDQYDDGYDGYGDYADNGYMDDGYGSYGDYADDSYQMRNYPDNVMPVDDSNTPYGTQNDLYDDTTAYIPRTQNNDYDRRSPRNQGYTRGGNQSPRRPDNASYSDPYRRGNGSQRRGPMNSGRGVQNSRRGQDGRNAPEGRRNPNDYRR